MRKLSFGWIGSLLIACMLFACSAFAIEPASIGSKVMVDAVSLYSDYSDTNSLVGGVEDRMCINKATDNSSISNTREDQINESIFAVLTDTKHIDAVVGASSDGIVLV